MSDNTFKTQSITTKDSTKFSLSLLSLSLLAALSMSNPAYADCTQDNSDPNKTVFHCEGEVSESTIDKIDDITGNVTIYNTGHINGFYPSPDTDQNTEIIAGAGSKLSGNFYFGGGSDTLTLSGADISDLTLLDADYQNAHFISGTETLNINQDITGGYSTNGKGTRIDGWDIINIGIDAKARVDLTSFISGLSAKPTSKIHIGRQGTLAIDSSNTVSKLYYHNVINEGTIDLSNAQEHELDEYKLMILGNYEGKPGSKIIVKSLWARDDASKNLKASFIILGRATGESEIVLKDDILDDETIAAANADGLIPTPVMIIKNRTDEEIDEQDGHEASSNHDEKYDIPLPEGAPTFNAKVKTLGIRDAELILKGNRYHWTVKIDGKDIISKPVVGYLQQPYINQQMMQEQLGKLHERIAKFDKALVEKQVWVRTNYDSTKLEGQDRFGADVKSSFIQIGGDIALSQSQDTQQRTGLMFTYGWANSKFSDQYKVEKDKIAADKFTGKARANMLSIGGYHTYYGKNGFYVDSVAQLSWLQNSYDSFDSKAKQNAWGLGASVEVGKAFPILNPKLAIEPQAQLTYQRIWFSGFTDGVKQVQQHSQDRLTARLGGRLIWTENINNKASQLYFSANLIQLLKGKDTSIQVGRESISESYGKLAAEFGVGGEYPITPNLSLYANMRYAMGLQSSGYKSYKGHIGLNYRF